MGTVTVVNLADAPIQSKISNAGNIYSGINGILPNTYYHHNAVSGTGYEVSVNWYVPGVTEDYPSSDLTRLGWYVAGGILAFLGLLATVVTFGVAGPLALSGGTLIWSSLSASAALMVGTMPAASLATLAGGALMTMIGPAVVLSGALHQVVQNWREVSFPYTIWGQSNDFLPVKGTFPLVPVWIDDHGHPGQKKLDGWKENKDLLEQSPIGFAETNGRDKMSEAEFDYLRRTGVVYQVKHVTQDYGLLLPGQSDPVPFKEGDFTDCTQGIVRMNLSAGGGPTRNIQAVANGPTLDVSRIYRIKLHPEGSSPNNDKRARARESILMAGADEGDHRVYLKHAADDEVRDGYSCTFWQFLPTREHGGGWIIVDRRYVRFLAFRGEEVLQYQSNEINGICLDLDGWATNISKPEIVWQVVSRNDGSVAIKQSKAGRDWFVTARTDGGFAIYPKAEYDGDVYQSWVIAAQ